MGKKKPHQTISGGRGPLGGAQASIAAVVRALFTIKQLDKFAELCIFIVPNPCNLRSDARQQRLNLML